MSEHDSSKRQFIKTAAYAAPLILTLKAAPSVAAIGSFADAGLGNAGDTGLGNGGGPVGGHPRVARLQKLHRTRVRLHRHRS